MERTTCLFLNTVSLLSNYFTIKYKFCVFPLALNCSSNPKEKGSDVLIASNCGSWGPVFGIEFRGIQCLTVNIHRHIGNGG